jgi:hypothetical protein
MPSPEQSAKRPARTVTRVSVVIWLPLTERMRPPFVSAAST